MHLRRSNATLGRIKPPLRAATARNGWRGVAGLWNLHRNTEAVDAPKVGCQLQKVARLSADDAVLDGELSQLCRGTEQQPTLDGGLVKIDGLFRYT